MSITYKTENRIVRAYHNNAPIGKVRVQDIHLHWSNGTFIPLAGIGGVGTDKACRGQGISSHCSITSIPPTISGKKNARRL